MSELQDSSSKVRITKDLSRFSVTTLTVVFCLVAYILVFLADCRDDAAIQHTDFVNSFYVAGRLVNDGFAEKLYPPPQSYNFQGAPFDLYAREILPARHFAAVYLFVYPPVKALFFAPLANFAPRTALIVWQIVSVFALFAASLCFCRVETNRSNAWLLFRQSFLLFTVAQVLIIGQSTLVLGLLPLSLGYFFWQKDKPIRAGLSWALLWMKPQTIVPVCMVIAALLIERLYKGKKADESADQIVSLVVGMTSGILLLIGIARIFVGRDAFVDWLQALALVNQMLSEPGSDLWAHHLLASLPGVILVALPPAWLHAGKLLALSLSSFVFLLGMTCLIRITHLRLEKCIKRDLLLAFAVGIIPLMFTYLRLYDLVLLLFPAWIVCNRFPEQSRAGRLSRITIMFMLVAVNVYLLMIVVPGFKPPGWYMVVVLLGFAEAYRRISGAVLTESPKD